MIVDLGDAHTIGEGRDVQHVEKSGLRCSDLASCLDELQIGRDFNGTTSNLGGDTESLEERGLSGFHSSVTSGDIDIGGCDCTSSGRSSNLVGEDLITDGLEVAIGEDESDVALDEREETLVLWAIGEESLDGATNLQIWGQFPGILSVRRLSYHGVLAHQDNTLTAEGVSNLVHLLGADIVDCCLSVARLDKVS